MSSPVIRASLLAILLLFASTVLAAPGTQEMRIFAVTNDGQGLEAKLVLEVEPGTGKVWTSIEPLVGTTTQSAERTAVKVAAARAPKANEFDYKFTIQSQASLVEGPSAGAAMALLALAELQSKQLPGYVSMTGTIAEDGVIGTVGGVFEKTRAAAESGIKLFLIPAGEARRIERTDQGIESLNLVEYGPKTWGVKVVEVATLDDAIRWAFSPVEDINPEELVKEEPPEFVPPRISYGENLEPMRRLTQAHLSKTKSILRRARESLSSTLLDDASTLTKMVGSLNAAEKSLRQAEILFEQNYFYSAANFSFLTRVNAYLIQDIAENPSLLSSDSTVLALKIDVMREDLERLEQELSKEIPVETLEWFLSAQQRLSWAKLTLNEVAATRSVSVGGNGEQAALDLLYKLESAAAWLEVAEAFHEASQGAPTRLAAGPALEAEANALLVKAENRLAVLEGIGVDDIQRRLRSAREELKKGWSMSAYLNAASALALIDGRQTANGEANAAPLRLSLEDKLNNLRSRMGASRHVHIWATLYLAHAQFYLEEADHYLALNHASTAVGSLQNGLSLVTLAEGTFDAGEYVFDQVERGRLFSAAPADSGALERLGLGKYYVLFFFLPAALFVVLLFFVLKFVRSAKQGGHYSVLEQIKEVKARERKLEERFGKRLLSEADYFREKGRLREDLRMLLRMRDERSEKLMQVDKLRAGLLAFKRRQLDLKDSFKRGLISKAEFDKLLNEYEAQIRSLREATAEGEKALDEEPVKAVLGREVQPEKPAPRAFKSAPPTTSFTELQGILRRQREELLKKKTESGKS